MYDRRLTYNVNYTNGSLDRPAAFSASLRGLALDLSKIASDLRLMTSGPRTGLDEIVLPAVQPGSSIMPGKINPSIPEMVNQVCFQVIGCDTTVAIAAEHGQLELNVMMPVIAQNVLLSMQLNPPKDGVNPLLYVGILVTALGAAMVLYFKPAH